MLTRTVRAALMTALLLVSLPSSAASLETLQMLTSAQEEQLSAAEMLEYGEIIVSEIQRLAAAVPSSSKPSFNALATSAGGQLRDMKGEGGATLANFRKLKTAYGDAVFLLSLSAEPALPIGGSDGEDDTRPILFQTTTTPTNPSP